MSKVMFALSSFQNALGLTPEGEIAGAVYGSHKALRTAALRRE
jgi:hypothetical protein